MEKEEKQMMSIIGADGSVEDVEVIVSFKFTDNNQEYVIYTKNEKDANGNVTVYVSHVVREEGEEDPSLEAVSDDAEWNRIKDLLRELVKAGEQAQ